MTTLTDTQPHTRSLALTEPLHFRSGSENVVEGLIVPFNRVANVVEMFDGEVHKYDEGFRPGSLTRMTQGVKSRGRADFIKLTLDHSERLDRWVGQSMEIEQRDEGGWASFKLHDRADLDHVKSIIANGYDGMSIEFVDTARPEVVDGVVWRRQVHISAVALTPEPTFSDARVLAMRAHELPSFGTPALDETQAWLAALVES
jgi:hypothetical protein